MSRGLALGNILLASILILGLGGCVATTSSGPVDAAAVAAQIRSVSAAEVELNVEKFSIKNGEIAYAELGTGSELFLLNGTGSPMADWDPALLAGLARNHRVIVFDYPGLGESSKAPKKITFPHLAKWSFELLDELQVRNFDLLGWSMGGFVAQEMMAKQPDRIRRVILSATNPGGSQTTLGPKWAQEIDSDSGSGIDSYLATNFPLDKCGRKAGKQEVRRVNRAISEGRYPDSKVPGRTYRQMVYAEDPWLRSNKNWKRLRSSALPVLAITGKDDVLTPPKNSKRIAGAVRDGHLTIVRGAAHAFLFQNADLISKYMSDFLTAADPRSIVTRHLGSTCG